MEQLPYNDLLLEFIHSWTYDVDFLAKIKKEFSSKHKLADIPSNIQLIKSYRELLLAWKIKKDIKLEQVLKKRGIRSQSGIVSVQVLTKPRPCPGQCIFCPNEPDMPKSYIKSEPWAMRASFNQFDPIKQVYNRLHSLSVTGHDSDKIEMIVLGGTFDSYMYEYKTEFIKQLYDAANTFDELIIDDEWCGIAGESKYVFDIMNLKKITYSKTLAEAIKKNESTKHRIIWLTIETRPDFVNDKNCQFWRELGVTRIEIGIQSLDDDVLDANKRGHSVQQIRDAFHIIRKYGFKITSHIMPGLYTSSYEKDLKTFVDLYADPYLKPDEIKFYPTSVIPDTKLAELYQKGEYKPLETEDIKKLIKQTFLEVIPPYTRIKRLIRDIPATEIMAGSTITNLGQLMHTAISAEMKGWDAQKLRKFYERLYPNNDEIQTSIVWKEPDLETFRNFVCLDTRSREIRHRDEWQAQSVNLIIRSYKSSVGMEYFISYEDQLGYLYGFARLMLPYNDTIPNPFFLNTHVAMIRELHVYGNVQTLKNTGEQSQDWDVQHTGFGKKLMEVAENIAKSNAYEKIAVISGVWVRAYYEKLWYVLDNTYMTKEF